jgi:integrase
MLGPSAAQAFGCLCSERVAGHRGGTRQRFLAGDLRHTGNQLAAGTGATLRELMDRMGHSIARAALIYLHGSDQRQQEIAQALSDLPTLS